MGRRLAAVSCAAAAAFFTPFALSATGEAVSGSCVPPPVAHRGASYTAPENTRPAFRRALRAGVRVLEMDVRFTAGGVPVVIHDATVDRTTNGSGAVADLSLAALRRLDAGSWFSRAYVGTRVPTLFEVLKDGIAYHATYLVDLKVRPTPQQLSSVLARFDHLGVRGKVLVTSRIAETIDDIRATAPDVRTAIIDNRTYREPTSVLQYGNACVISHRSVTAENALSWRTSGIAVYSWTVDTPTGWLRMADEVVAGIITNRPVRYLAWARSFCG